MGLGAWKPGKPGESWQGGEPDPPPCPQQELARGAPSLPAGCTEAVSLLPVGTLSPDKSGFSCARGLGWKTSHGPGGHLMLGPRERVIVP